MSLTETAAYNNNKKVQEYRKNRANNDKIEWKIKLCLEEPQYLELCVSRSYGCIAE